MTLATLNIIVSIVLVFIFILLIFKYGKSMFFDVSIVYTFVVLLAPLIFFITNLIYLLLFSNNNIYIAVIPLLVPVIYYIFSKVKKNSRKKLYIHAKQLVVKTLVDLAHKNDLKINDEDIRIRIKEKNKIDFILNIYNDSEEEVLKKLIEENEKRIITQMPNRKIRFLFDEKKNKSIKRINMLCMYNITE